MKSFLSFLAFSFTLASPAMAFVNLGATEPTVNCQSKGASLGGYKLEILDEGGAQTAHLTNETIEGPVKVMDFNVDQVQVVTHGLEKIYEGPGFSLLIEVGTPKGSMAATLDHGREINLDLNCSY